MSDLFWLTESQIEQLRPCFPCSHGVPRVDDRPVLSGIIFVSRNGLRWRDAPAAYGLHKTLYNRWLRWSRTGLFARMLSMLAAAAQQTGTPMIDATHLKVHRTAASLRSRSERLGRVSQLIGLTNGGLNSKLHVVADAGRRPIRLFLSAGHLSDDVGATALVSSLPDAKVLIADRRYDADWLRSALADRSIAARIPCRTSRKVAIPFDPTLYRQRHRIENMLRG